MSATDELRRLLDERGVEWWSEDDPEEPAYYFVTKWFANAHEQKYEEIPAIRGKSLKAFCVSPEQAIAATLGSEFNPDGLPVGLTISDDSNLLNWRGENYVKQSTLGSGTLTAERDYWKEQFMHCLTVAIRQERGDVLDRLMSYPRPADLIEPYQLVTDEVYTLRDFLAESDKERMAYRHLLLRISDEIATELDNG